MVSNFDSPLDRALVRHPLTVPPEIPLTQAIALMSRARSSYVLVVDTHQQASQRLLGILTERDLVQVTASQISIEGVEIAHVMTPQLITLQESEAEDLLAVLKLLRQHRIRHLPIVDFQGQCKGIITHESIRQALKPTDLLKIIKVAEVMTTRVVTAEPTASVLELTQLMATHKCSCVVISQDIQEKSQDSSTPQQTEVTVENSPFNPQPSKRTTQPLNFNPQSLKNPIGVVTERDIVQYHALGLDFTNLRASTVMSAPLLRVRATESLWQAHQLMEGHHVRRVVVTGETGELQGLVTQTNLLQVLDPMEMQAAINALQITLDEQTTELRQANQQLQTAIAHRHQVETQLQQANQELEQIVEERTAALKKALERQQAEIFQRQLAQKLLHFSEERFRQLAENIDQVFWLISTDRKQLIYMSPAFEKVWGVPREILQARSKENPAAYLEAIGSSIYSEDRQRVMQDWPEKLLHEEQEYRILRPDGEMRWVRSRGFPVRNEKGEVYRIAGITTDITERKQAEEARRESEERFRQLVETTSDWVWELDANGVYTYASPRIQDMLGYQPEEILGKTFCELMPPAEAKRIGEILRAIAQRQEPFNLLENINLHKNGKPVVIESSGVPIFDTTGKFKGYRGIDRDITERKQTQKALQQLNHELEMRVQQQTAELRQLVKQLQGEIGRREQVELALRESEERLESILGSLNDVVWSVSVDSLHLVYLNPAVERVYQRSREEFLDDPTLWIGVVHPQDRDRVSCLSEALLTTGAKDLEYRILRPNGEVRWLHDRGQLTCDSRGIPIRLDGVARDITDRKQAEEALGRSERRFRAIFDQTFQFMVLLTPEGIVLEINQTALDFWKMKAADAIGHPIWKCRCWQTKNKRNVRSKEMGSDTSSSLSPAGKRLQTAIPGVAAGNLWRDEVEVVGPDNVVVTIDISIKPVRDECDRVVQLIAEGRDISDRKRLETEILEREQLLNSFFTASSSVSLGLGIVDERMRYLQVNEALAELNGLPAREHIGKTLWDIIPDMARQLFPLVEESLATGTPILNVELSGEINTQPGIKHHWLACSFPIPLRNGLSQGIGFIVLDITKRKQAEEALRAIQERLEYLLSANPTIIYSKALGDYSTTFVSQNIGRQFGYEAQQLIDNPIFWLERIHPDDRHTISADRPFLFERGAFIQEYRFQHQDGSYRWVRDEMRLMQDQQGNPLEIIGSMYDVTEQKKAEQQLKTSLQEKEVLLKEIHHRVKNNLQVISSLLNLQSRSIQEEKIRSLFQDSQNRIQSIAFIHEKLYLSQDIARVDFCQYIKTLGTHLLRSYSAHPTLVTLNININDIFLSVDTAIPCGLIVNELLCNALKHGWSAGSPGEITVEMYPTGVEKNVRSRPLVLVVRDNGVGFPTEVNFRKTKSLGMQLVTTLVKQLKGTMDLESGEGTAFRIVFWATHIQAGSDG